MIDHIVRTLDVVTEVLCLHLLDSALLNGKIIVKSVVPSLRNDLCLLVVTLSCELVSLHYSIHSEDFKVSILFKSFFVGGSFKSLCNDSHLFGAI